MRNLQAYKKIIGLILEGFAKQKIYTGQVGSEVDLIRMGNSIDEAFDDLTKDIKDEKVKDKIRFVLIKYMIIRLSRPLRKDRREQLIMKYGTDLEYNKERRVFWSILNVAHEIIHEILHEGSVEYFEAQNMGLNRDLQVEYIYDFLEAIATMFDEAMYWKDKRILWIRFESYMRSFFKEWLKKNEFFVIKNNFDREYDRFINAFSKLHIFANMNNIFLRFSMTYIEKHVHPLILDQKFKDEVEGRLFQIDADYGYEHLDNREMEALESLVYSFIIDKIMEKLRETYKDRFIITVDIMSKANQVLYELHEIALKRIEILKIIKNGILKREKNPDGLML